MCDSRRQHDKEPYIQLLGSNKFNLLLTTYQRYKSLYIGIVRKGLRQKFLISKNRLSVMFTGWQQIENDNIFVLILLPPGKFKIYNISIKFNKQLLFILVEKSDLVIVILQVRPNNIQHLICIFLIQM